MPTLQERFEDRGTGGHKELQPDLEPFASAIQPGDQGCGRGCIRKVEGHDEAVAGFHERV